MKKCYLLFAALIWMTALSAQFSDDFESYSNGSYLAQTSPNWTTWNNSPGTTEDVKIVNTDAHSGSQSIYFQTTSSSGGPSDVVLPFGGEYNTGTFDFEMWMKVEANKGAYFNFQAETTPGDQWAFECFFWDDGSITVSSESQTWLTGSYPTNQWFKMEVKVNLNQNNWEFLVNGNSQGSFNNPVNQLSSLDIFPTNPSSTNNNAGYYIDDVAYTYTPYTLPTVNAALTFVDVDLNFATHSDTAVVTVRNLGQQTINSFDLTIDYDGNQLVENITGISLASLSSMNVPFSQPLTAVAGSKSLVATVSNVNGNTNDGDPGDDQITLTIDPVVPAPGKVVVVEEATGTWCGWCPRGTVAMAEMQEKYPDHFAGIAVHNGDPMTDDNYDSGLGALISGYPSAMVDREADIDPSDIEEYFLQHITQLPMALVSMDATYNSTTNMLQTDVELVFQQSTSGTWRLALALTENDVAGTSASYAQSNYYSGYAVPLVGAGRDWNTASNPVPANEMEYDHVARMITPSFSGDATIIPTTINAGDTVKYSFYTQIDNGWNKDKMHAVAILLSPNGQVDNGATFAVEDAAISATAIASPSQGNWQFDVWPNPAKNSITLRFSQDIDPSAIYITDVSGKNIVYISHPELQGNAYQIPVNKLAGGIYFIHVNIGSSLITHQLVVQQ